MSSRRYYICKPFFDRDSLQCSDSDLDSNEEPTLEEQYAEIAEMFVDDDDDDDDEYYYYDDEYFYIGSLYRKAKDYFELQYLSQMDVEFRVSELYSLQRNWYELTRIENGNLFIFSTAFNYLKFNLSFLLEHLSSADSSFTLLEAALPIVESENIYYHLKEKTIEQSYGYCVLQHEKIETLIQIKNYLNNLLSEILDVLYDNETIINGKRSGITPVSSLISIPYFANNNHNEFLYSVFSYSHQQDLEKKLEFENKYLISSNKKHSRKRI